MPDWLSGVPRKLDDFLIDRVFQPICDHLARWCDCYGIAEFISTGAVALVLLRVGIWITDGDPWMALVGVFLATTYAFNIWRIRFLVNRPKQGFLPMERALSTCLMTRIFLALYGILLVWADPYGLSPTLTNVAWWLFTASWYFTACRRNPPKPKKARAPGRLLRRAA